MNIKMDFKDWNMDRSDIKYLVFITIISTLLVSYMIDFNLVDPDTLLMTNCETVKIYATTTDEELRVSEFEELSSQGYEGPPKRIENGDAFICMYGSGRSVEWDF